MRPLRLEILCGADTRCRALLPDLLKFSYVPITEMQQNEESIKSSGSSVDYSKALSLPEKMESKPAQVLVLEFMDNTARKRDLAGSTQSMLFYFESVST